MSGRAIRAHPTITIKIVSYLIRDPKMDCGEITLIKFVVTMEVLNLLP